MQPNHLRNIKKTEIKGHSKITGLYFNELDIFGRQTEEFSRRLETWLLNVMYYLGLDPGPALFKKKAISGTTSEI